MKRCTKCGEAKAPAEFPIRKGLTGRSTLHSWCRECRNASSARWGVANPEKRKAAAKRLRECDIEKNRAYQRERYRARRETDALAIAATSRAESAQSRGADVLEHVVPLVVLEMQDGVCGICEQDLDPFFFHIDHKIPVAWGGNHCYENVHAVHPECNFAKNLEETAWRRRPRAV
jgi:hypothetical protein